MRHLSAAESQGGEKYAAGSIIHFSSLFVYITSILFLTRNNRRGLAPSSSTASSFSGSASGCPDTGYLRILRARYRGRPHLLPWILVPPLRRPLVYFSALWRSVGVCLRSKGPISFNQPAARLPQRATRPPTHPIRTAQEKLENLGRGKALGQTQ